VGSDSPTASRYLRWQSVIAAVAIGVYAMWVVAWFADGHLPGDAFTYLAAGQRLNAGHDVYRLTQGDSPVLMPPPYPPYPLFSPPLIAVIFRPLAALPGDAGAWLWWALAAPAVALSVLVSIGGRPVIASLVVVALSFSLGVLTGVGNVDAFLLSGVFLVWALLRPADGAPPGRREVAAGIVVGILVSVKIIPLALVWWLLATRRWRAVTAAALASAVCVVVVFVEYLAVVRDASGAIPGAASTAGLARLVGLPAELSPLVQWTSLALMLAAVVVLSQRGRTSLAFSVACVSMVLGSPAAAAHTPALLLGAMAPYAIEALRRHPPSFVVLGAESAEATQAR
jgi:hypothetical protein